MAGPAIREGRSFLTVRSVTFEMARAHGWIRAAALSAAAASLVLLFARSWRIDYPYSIDFQVYWLAGSRVAAGEADRLYEPGGGPERGLPLTLPRNEFKNLPIVSLAFVPFAGLDYPAAKRLFWWIGLASLLGSAILIGAYVLPETVGDVWIRVGWAVALLCSMAPAHTSLRHGQTTPVVLLALTGYVVAELRRRRTAAGALLAAASLVKLPVLGLAALDAVRRRWRVFATWLAVLASIVALSVILFGPALHVPYLQGLGEHAGTVMTGHNNQSVVAVVQRLAHGVAVYDWEPRPLSWSLRVAAAIVTALLGAGVWRALVRFPAAGDPPDAARFRLETPAVLAFGIVAMPVAWDHYFLLLAPLVAALATGLLRGGSSRPFVSATLALCYLALALPTPQAVLDGASDWGLPGSLLISHYFFGAVLVLGLAAAGPGPERTRDD